MARISDEDYTGYERMEIRAYLRGAKAQLRRVVNWGGGRCDGDELHYGQVVSPPALKRNCSECWQSLLK